jgi:hypothetical protein
MVMSQNDNVEQNHSIKADNKVFERAEQLNIWEQP